MEQWLGTILLIAVVSAPALAVAVLTGVGQRRRSGRWWQVMLAAVFWPAAWVVWYVGDGGLRAAGTRLVTRRP